MNCNYDLNPDDDHGDDVWASAETLMWREELRGMHVRHPRFEGRRL